MARSPAGMAVVHGLQNGKQRGSSQQGGIRCFRCRVPQPPAVMATYAEVLHRSVFAPDCRHGPFCARCRHAVTAQVLPSCACRALVASWREAAWPSTATVPEPRLPSATTAGGSLSSRAQASVTSGMSPEATSKGELSTVDVQRVEEMGGVSCGIGEAGSAFLSWENFIPISGSYQAASGNDAILVGAGGITSPGQDHQGARSSAAAQAPTENQHSSAPAVAMPVQTQTAAAIKRGRHDGDSDPTRSTRARPGLASGAGSPASVATFAAQAAAAAARRHRR